MKIEHLILTVLRQMFTVLIPRSLVHFSILRPVCFIRSAPKTKDKFDLVGTFAKIGIEFCGRLATHLERFGSRSFC